MVFAAVLAGGIGSRMGANTPKQYLKIGGRSILNITVSKFLEEPVFEQVVVLVPEDWTAYTREHLQEAFGETDRLKVLSGGATRNDTLSNAIRYFETHYELDDDSLLVTHDAVPPFAPRRIIRENIEQARTYGACGTAIPAVDTILRSRDGGFIDEIPDRAELFQMQTPQTFRIRKLEQLMRSLTEEETEILTDGCKIFTLKGEPVSIVRGEPYNLKITYPYDLKIGEALAASGLDSEEEHGNS